MLLRLFHSAVPRLMRRSRRANPGAAYQVQELEHAEVLEHDPEGFGNVESNFMHVHRTHRQHEAAVAEERERIRLLMVKHKYFRDQKLPNLLTYAEKEQVRLLHARDPEEWTADRLAESFPATPDVIRKILRADWRPRSTKRIREHDEAVVRNWQQIRAGSGEAIAQLPPELLEHLLKFADRKVEDLLAVDRDSWPTRLAVPKPLGKEFLSIITSCDRYADSDGKPADSQDVPLLRSGGRTTSAPTPGAAADADDETYLTDRIVDKRKMRLEDLKRLKLTAAELANSRGSTAAQAAGSTSLEQRAIEAFGNPSGTGVLPPTAGTAAPSNNHLAALDYVEKFESSEIVVGEQDRKRFEMTTVKDRVHIPRKMWRKGATYRVEDCYYDDDGEFLYRVPGMTGRQH